MGPARLLATVCDHTETSVDFVVTDEIHVGYNEVQQSTDHLASSHWLPSNSTGAGLGAGMRTV